MTGRLNFILSETAKSNSRSLRLEQTTKKMRDSFQMLKQERIRSGESENDPEIVFLDKMIREFDADLKKTKD